MSIVTLITMGANMNPHKDWYLRFYSSYHYSYSNGPLDLISSDAGFTSPLVFLYFLLGVLISLAITQPVPASKFGRISIRFAYFLLFGGCFAPGMVYTMIGLWTVGGGAALYLLLSILDGCITQARSRRSKTSSGQRDDVASMSQQVPASAATAPATPRGTIPTTGRTQTPQPQSLELTIIDTQRIFSAPRRHDTEAEIGVPSPRKRWIFQL